MAACHSNETLSLAPNLDAGLPKDEKFQFKRAMPIPIKAKSSKPVTLHPATARLVKGEADEAEGG